MKKRPPVVDRDSINSTAVRTGEHCPDTGWWLPVAAEETHAASRFIGRGSVMPAVAGTPTLWVPSGEC